MRVHEQGLQGSRGGHVQNKVFLLHGVDFDQESRIGRERYNQGMHVQVDIQRCDFYLYIIFF